MHLDHGQGLPPAQTLQAFEAAARHMSFTAAARELGITQAAVSQRIRVLEHRLGQTLFLRDPRGLGLTEAGRALVPAVREGFERIAGGLAETVSTGGEAPVTVRTTPGFAAHWLAPRIDAFRRAHPGIRLRIVTAVWPSDFDLAGADLEIRYGHGDWAGVQSRRLTRERLAPVCAPSVAGGLRRPSDLAGRTLLHAVGFRSGWRDWLAAQGATDVLGRSVPLLADTIAVILAFARHGAGIAMGRTGFVEAALDTGELVAPFDAWLATDEAFHLVRPAEQRQRPDAEAFWQWLADAAVS